MLGAALTLCALIAFATELDIDQDVQGAAIDSEQKQHLQQAVGLGEEIDALAEWGSAEKASQGKEKAGTEKASPGKEGKEKAGPEKASPEKASPGPDKASQGTERTSQVPGESDKSTELDNDAHGAAIDSEQKQHLQQAVGLGEEIDALAEWGSAEKASQGKEGTEKASPGADKASPERKAELGEEEKARWGFIKRMVKPVVSGVTARIKAARVRAARVRAARIKAARIKAARVKAARVKAARIKAARIKAARIKPTDSIMKRRRRSAPKGKCSQPKLPNFKCPDGFMPIANSAMNIDDVTDGVRLLARGVSCKCTKMPGDVQKILVKQSKCKVTLYSKTNFKGSKLRTLTSPKRNGKVFVNNNEETMTDDLGEDEDAMPWRRRRRSDKDWGKHVQSAKLEGACAQVEYVGVSSTAASAGVLECGCFR